MKIFVFIFFIVLLALFYPIIEWFRNLDKKD
jgi:hypothetical protein